MIDIHSHILHGLDDGADSFETSIAMVQIAKNGGTTDIVATPHANTSYIYEPDIVESRIVQLQQAIGPAITIHRGCDFHLSPQNIQAALEEPHKFSINGLGYLLVEFPQVAALQGIEQIFGALSDAGLRLIVTHPERNQYLAGNLPRLSEWVTKGIYLQLTAQSITGELFGPDVGHWCNRALSMGLVHFVASDAHDPHVRTPRLDQAATCLQEQFGEEYAELLLEIHPRSVLDGRPISIGPVPPPKRKKKKWFHLGS